MFAYALLLECRDTKVENERADIKEIYKPNRQSPKMQSIFPGTHNGQRLRKIRHKYFDNYFPIQYSTMSFDKLWDSEEIRNRVLYKVKRNAFTEFLSKTQYWSGRGAISSNVSPPCLVAAKIAEYSPLF